MRDRQCPRPRVKLLASNDNNLNVIFNICMTGSSNQVEIVLLSEVEALDAVVQVVLGKPHWARFFRVLDNKGKRSCAWR